MRAYVVVAAFAAVLLAGSPAAAFQTPPPSCAQPLKGPGKPLRFQEPLAEPDRLALSAGVFLALSDTSGRAAWPAPQIDAAPACPLASFEADDVTWTISGGMGDAPPRWVSAPGRTEYFFVARGAGLADARAWSTARTPIPTFAGPPAYYLAGATNGSHFVFRIYDGPPDTRQIADDLVAVMTGKVDPLALFDPTGDAVSVSLLTESGRVAELFRPGLIHSQRSATLYGPDGLFFTPTPEHAVVMRGSGLVCADSYGGFLQARLTVLDARDETLDLGCSLEAEEGDSWITVFSTRLPDASADKAAFARRIKEAQAEGGVSGQTPGIRSGRTKVLQAGKAWIDKAGAGQGLWFMRRGEYVVEVRATFETDAADDVFGVLEALLLNRVPEQPPADGPA